MICKRVGGYVVFWGPDGWQGGSTLACKYGTKAAAEKVLEFLDLKPMDGVSIEPANQ